MKIVKHHDLSSILRTDEWQRIAHAISDLINKQENITNEQATRAVLYALQVAAVADSTCKGCGHLELEERLLWPVAMERVGGDHRMTYVCKEHGGYKFFAGHLNAVDVSGLA
jgi:hypothetical protein